MEGIGGQVLAAVRQQLVVLQEESVVSETRCNAVETRSWYMFSKIPLLLNREKSVTVYTDYRTVSLDGRKGIVHSTASASDIMAVHRTAEIIIGIGVKAV